MVAIIFSKNVISSRSQNHCGLKQSFDSFSKLYTLSETSFFFLSFFFFLFQVTLGISTLLLYVPTHLAALHQAGAVSLLTIALWLTNELRKPLVPK